MGIISRCLWVCNSEEMSPTEWAGFAAGITAVLVAFFGGLRYLIKGWLWTLTLNQQDGGTISASWTDLGLTSVGVSMPSAQKYDGANIELKNFVPQDMTQVEFMTNLKNMFNLWMILNCSCYCLIWVCEEISFFYRLRLQLLFR